MIRVSQWGEKSAYPNLSAKGHKASIEKTNVIPADHFIPKDKKAIGVAKIRIFNGPVVATCLEACENEIFFASTTILFFQIKYSLFYYYKLENKIPLFVCLHY